jgi:YVTN family beta-propeller protein
VRRLPHLAALIVLFLGVAALPTRLVPRAAINPDFVHFESAHVHPLALTPNGDRLLAVSTADDRLVVFDLTTPAPKRIWDVPVGLEPVSVAALSDSQAWVVNQVSDDVSIVDLNARHVAATIHVGDEPSDVVFAGGAAYVSVSGEDQVKRYDTATRVFLGGVPINGRKPRALARDAAGTHVYVSVLQAGNKTSVLSSAEAGDSLPPPSPPMSASLPVAPKVGLIVQLQGADWRDETGRLWNDKIKYTVFDTDVADIVGSAVSRSFSGLNTVNLGLAVEPNSGAVVTTGTEARNLKRFEPNLRGHLVDTQISFITAAGTVTTRNLNPHIDYSVSPGPQSESDSSIGMPSGVAWSSDGARAYVTSMSSNKLAVVDPVAGVVARVATVGIPTGVLVDRSRQRVYVLGRQRGELQTLSETDFSTIGVNNLGFDPTPDAIVNGRRFFYGGFTSGHGDQSCASCHVFGDFDAIAWDLGNPTGTFASPPPGQVDPLLKGFHPMKGPMTTQTLRGLTGIALLHWRGDRANLDAFNPAFASLLGRAAQLPDSEMAAFDDFVLPLTFSANPNQFLDRSIPDAPAGQPSPLRGQTFFFNTVVDGGVLTCNGCHAGTNFGPGTNNQVIDATALQAPQDMKVPQLRNLYTKVGFTNAPGAQNKRGFAFTHDGSVDNLFDFLHFPGFNFAGGDPQRRDVEAFLLDFDTGMPPAVGREVTFSGANDTDPVLIATVDTLRSQAKVVGNCDLIAHGRVGGVPRSWLYQGSDQWQPDVAAGPTITTAQLRALGARGSEVTVLGVPLGSGTRMALDRDRDGYDNGDELAAGSDPGNPRSTPLNVGVGDGPPAGFALRSVGPNPFRTATTLEFSLGRSSRVDAEVFDVLGREVRVLARGQWFEAGPQRIEWDGLGARGAPVSGGVYFVRLRTAGGSWTRSVIKIR